MIVCKILGIVASMMQGIPMEMWIASAVSAVALSIAGAYWYFLGKTTQASFRQGLFVGLTFVLTGFVLDLAFFLSLSAEGYDPLKAMAMYYSRWPFWLTLVLILMGSAGMGSWLEMRKRK
jgi:lysylphosphatidylglycerol synthetase-like protein (DUF2156 family)